MMQLILSFTEIAVLLISLGLVLHWGSLILHGEIPSQHPSPGLNE